MFFQEFAMKEMKEEKRMNEDTLTVDPADEQHDVEHDNVPIISAYRANVGTDVSHQTPLELAVGRHKVDGPKG